MTRRDAKPGLVIPAPRQNFPRPMGAAEHVAVVAATRVEELERENASLRRQVGGLAEKAKTLQEQLNEVNGTLSHYVLATGGRAVVDAPDILVELRAIRGQLNAHAQVLTALALELDVRQVEREERVYLAEQDALGGGR